MKRAAVIGWPIEHSRSPLIHGHWLKTYGIDGSYTKIAVKPEAVAGFLATLAEQGLAGCNVTLPHKEAAFAAAAERDKSALAVGAANTLWLADGRLHAANTDTYGFMRHLDVSAPDWRQKDRPVLILGAGGAARGIVYGFLEAGVGEVRVANRTRSRAEEIARHFGPRVNALDWQDAAVGARDAGVLVNTTSLGMAKTGPLDFDVGRLPHDATVADIVYVPLETELLARARARGLVAVDGLGMLLHQAVPGFAKWFGVTPEVTPQLRDIIVRDIEGR
ncbi:MAG: shikimate dehydrogenase [Hyphomicrobiaceae bacterium]|nr:shikimate dehydrogenase [Hyphomicrobiaceae bacterium]